MKSDALDHSCPIELPCANFRCAHCGLESPPSARVPANGLYFCCNGCAKVYAVINELGLSQFYAYKEKSWASPGPRPEAAHASFKYLDDPAFIRESTRELKADLREVIFSLEGLHCAACVWLLERLPQILPGVKSSRVQFSTGTISVLFNSKSVLLSDIARRLESLGYTPHPRSDFVQTNALRKQSRALIRRIGVAALSTGNTMMIAVSLFQGWFTGIEVQYRPLLLWVSALISLPAVLYSATPFYRASLQGLRAGILHIDVPISLAIILGFSLSLINTAQGSLAVYYDSICALILLLLSARWIQTSGLTRLQHQAELLFSLSPRAARRLKSDTSTEEVFVGSLLPGDIIVVNKAEAIPADGRVIEGTTYIDAAMLTGESVPRKIVPGDIVFAGTRNIERAVKLEVIAAHHKSRIGTLLRRVEQEEHVKPKLLALSDGLSVWFVAIVLTLGLLTALITTLLIDFSTAFDRTLALLVVSCPCALGLAAPLAFTLSSHKARAKGIIIKNGEVLEQLAQAQHVVFDKTGTLTLGAPEVTRVFCSKAENSLEKERVCSAILALEENSEHPFAHALRAWAMSLSTASALSLAQRDYIPGKGYEGLDTEGKTLRLGAFAWVLSELKDPASSQLLSWISALRGDESVLALADNGAITACFAVADKERAEAKQVIDFLLDRKIQVHIASGDTTGVVNSLAEKLGVPAEQAHADLSPEDKVTLIDSLLQNGNTVFIGDGANDALALKHASVGIAVQGGAEASLVSADVFFTVPGLLQLTALLEQSERTIKAIKQNFALSASYNIFGITVAIFGYISPLVAAAIMPLSSLTVVLNSLGLKREKV